MRADLESLKGLQEVLKVLSELHKSSISIVGPMDIGSSY